MRSVRQLNTHKAGNNDNTGEAYLDEAGKALKRRSVTLRKSSVDRYVDILQSNNVPFSEFLEGNLLMVLTKYTEGKQLKQIAEEMNVSSTTVSNWLYSGAGNSVFTKLRYWIPRVFGKNK